MWWESQREDQELHSRRSTNGSVWARQCTECVYACPHLCPHPHGAHVSIMCNGLVRAGADVHLSVYECTSWQSVLHVTSGSRPRCAEIGLLMGQEITNYTGWTASPRYPVSASQNWEHKLIPQHPTLLLTKLSPQPKGYIFIYIKLTAFSQKVKPQHGYLRIHTALIQYLIVHKLKVSKNLHVPSLRRQHVFLPAQSSQ